MIPQLSFGFHAVVLRNEREVEAGGAHLSKTTKGGAATVIMVPTETKGGPAPVELVFWNPLSAVELGDASRISMSFQEM
jgi:hypothetical protein